MIEGIEGHRCVMQGIGPLKRNQSFTSVTNRSAAHKQSTVTTCMENFKKIFSILSVYTKDNPPTPQKTTTKTHTQQCV